MDLELIKQITTGIITFVAGYLLKNFEPKAKVLWWSTHAFRFNLPNPPHPNALVFTRSITIQNVGRRIAENIEISHASLPGFFKLQPALDYTPTETPTGEHIIRVATLGPRQFFTIEFISFNEAPVLSYVKSADGLAQPIAIQPQRVWPRWYLTTIQALVLVGLGVSAYWIVRAFYTINALI